MDKTRRKFHYGYLVILGLIIVNMMHGVLVNVDSIYYVPVSEAMGVSVSTYGMSMTISGYATALFMSLYVKVYSKCKMRTVLLLITVDNCLFFLLRAIGTHIAIWYITAFLFSFSAGLVVFMVNPTIIPKWFAKKQGFWIGVCACTQGLSGWIFQSVGGYIIEAYSWRTSYWFFFVLVAAMGVLATLIIRRDPAEMDLKPVGYEEKAEAPSDTLPAQSEKLLQGIEAPRARRMPVFWAIMVWTAIYGLANVFNSYFNTYCREELSKEIGPCPILYRQRSCQQIRVPVVEGPDFPSFHRGTEEARGLPR